MKKSNYYKKLTKEANKKKNYVLQLRASLQRKGVHKLDYDYPTYYECKVGKLHLHIMYGYN